MTAPSPPAPPGSLLSCYTAAIAHFLTGIGADAEMALGTQLYLAVRPTSDDRVAFIHQHTPLRGDRLTHRAELVRHSTDDAVVAVRRMLAELDTVGRVIAVGDAAALPWHPGAGRRHVPHWFVIDGHTPGGTAVHVTDLLECEGDDGVQRTHAGWVRVERLPPLVRVVRCDRTASARDRHAFGEVHAPDTRCTGPYQWFECRRPPVPRPVGPREILTLLASTWAHQVGFRRRADLATHGWWTGSDALRWLAEWLAPRLDRSSAYAVADDLWVAARNRQLFARVVGRSATETGHDGLAALAAVADDVAREWSALLRLLAYNRASLARGRTVRNAPVAALHRVAEREASLMELLGAAVLSGDHR
jgi:hypothetical protein